MLRTIAYTCLFLFILRILYERRRDKSLPPGPRRLPFIGNLHQAPQELPWRAYQEWAKTYGPIFSLQYGKDTLVVITDGEHARNLLDKKGSIYSDRPRLVMFGECTTKGMHLLLRPYDERYRLHQRLEAPALSPRASSTYLPVQDMESKQLLVDFLNKPDFRKNFERFSASLIYTLVYGFRVSTGNEQCLIDAHKVQDNAASAGTVGKWIVDALPFLNHLPTALAPWKKTAEMFYQLEAKMHLENLEAGLNSKSWNWTKDFHSAQESSTMPRIELAYDLGILADAGLDTTSLVCEVFILACLSFPAFMTTAQKELDEVVGKDRLPSLSDRDDLPYMRAVVRECLRWRPILPFAFPHRNTREDYYLGYRIPAGSTVIAVSWAINLDESVYNDAAQFRPERWLGVSEEQRTASFGFGRRMCTGRHIAANSLWLVFARLLWLFDIKHAVGPDGERKEVDPFAFTSGFASKPLPFEAVFEPRDERRREVAVEAWEMAEKDVDVLMDGVREQQVRIGLKPRA